jgi:adenine-specific DNA-methyltransferase
MPDMPLLNPTTTAAIGQHFDPAHHIALYHGDVADALATIPPDSIKLIITSPPYNLGKGYEHRESIQHYLEKQASIIARLCSVLRPDGSICWQVGNFVQGGEVFPLDVFYYDIFKQHGMALRNRIIWHFGHGLHASRRFSGRYETILWFTRSDSYTFNLDAVRVPAKYPGKCHYKGPNKGKPSGNPKGKNPSDIWEVLADEWESGLWDIPNVKSNHPEKTAHPCQFPVELAERCVLALTNENDWVFDPYAGVGSALIAAIKHRRRAMGSEKEAAYVALAQQRIQAYFDGTIKLRPMGKPVHTPTGNEKVARPPVAWETSDGNHSCH